MEIQQKIIARDTSVTNIQENSTATKATQLYVDFKLEVNTSAIGKTITSDALGMGAWSPLGERSVGHESFREYDLIDTGNHKENWRTYVGH